MTSISSHRGLARVLMVASSMLAAIWACPTALGAVSGNRSELVDHQKDKPLDVRSEDGDIEIVRTPSETGKVRVRLSLKAESKERLNQTKLDAKRDADGTLVVQVAWPGGERKHTESASIKVEIPDMSEIRAQTSNGSIRLNDTTGHAILVTANGGINVRGHTGDLAFETTNGKSEVRNVSGKVEGRGVNGGLSVEHAAGPVSIETTNGDLRIRLTPENKGPVNAETTNGGIELAVGKVYAGTIKAQTANGDVTIELPGLIKSMKQDRREQVVELNAPGEDTTLKASNDDVKVRLLEEAPKAEPGEKK